MSHDDANGVITYNKNNDSIDITWDRVGYEKNFMTVNHAMEKVTKGLKGTFVKNPTWTAALGKSVVSAHPLGGCSMGESGRTAVVNHAGQVFDGKHYEHYLNVIISWKYPKLQYWVPGSCRALPTSHARVLRENSGTSIM